MHSLFRALRDLPNEEGFRFIGVDTTMTEFNCVIRKDAAGMHSVYREADNEPFFMKLYAWRPLTAAERSAS